MKKVQPLVNWRPSKLASSTWKPVLVMKSFLERQGSRAEIAYVAAQLFSPWWICRMRGWNEKRGLLLRVTQVRDWTKVLIKLWKSREKPSCSPVQKIKSTGHAGTGERDHLAANAGEAPAPRSVEKGFGALEFPKSDRNESWWLLLEEPYCCGFPSTYSGGPTWRTDQALEHKSIKHL